MRPAPSIAVFDLGNVLIEWDRRLLFSQIIDDPVELDYFLDEVFNLDANRLLDQGMPLPEVVERIALEHPEHRQTVSVLRDRWVETLGGVIEGSVEIVEELHARAIPLYALSNWGADTFALIEADYDFLALFDGLVISGREGVTKPDPAIFSVLTERHGFEAREAVFIDDSTSNIEAAGALGFDTILFVGPDDLRLRLGDRGLL